MPSPNNTHLFILCPPYCGSTLLHRIISSSKSVSSNNYFDTREGQQLPELKDKMFIKGRWEEDFKVDWPYTKKIWYQYWDTTKPILLEKSPANLMRAEQINKYFDRSYFIIMVRNPYAHAEGLMRRNGWDAERAGEFVLKCLKQQKVNYNFLEKKILINYEELVTDPIEVKNRIREFVVTDIGSQLVPGISYDLNTKKINSLSTIEKDSLNQIFKTRKEVMDYFNYSILE